MKKLETAPAWYEDELYNEAVSLRKKLNLSGILAPLNNEYLYWDKVKYKKVEDIRPEILWTLLKLNRLNTEKEILFGAHKFSYNLTNLTQKALHEFDLNIGGNLSSKSIVPEDDKKRYLLSSIMEEAIASSQIEGAVTTRKHAKEILRKNIKPKNLSEQMIVNNFITIKHIVDIKNESIDFQKIAEIHKLITNETLEDREFSGKYRNDNEIKIVDISDGEIVHTPPDFKEIEQLMNELFTFFNTNEDDQFIHPIIKGCIIHFMIGYIHPFIDGNGRTARALFYWFLLKNGYWLTEYLSISRLIVKSKTQYAKAFLYTETDGNDLTYFINYKIRTMEHAYADLKIYIERKIKEKQYLTNYQKIKGVNERQAEIIKWIDEEPDLLFSVKEIENRFNISNQTARTDLIELENKGFLEAIDINKKTKGFTRSKNFKKLLSELLP